MRRKGLLIAAVVVAVVVVGALVAVLGLDSTPAKSLDAARSPAVQVKPKPASYGPVPLGKTHYRIPAGAHFVAPHGSDSAAGSKAAPWRTVGRAARAGGVIVLRAGTYHEDLELTGRKVTLQPYPGEVVWFDGSQQVTGWVRDGSTWRKDGWTAKFDSTDPNAHGSSSLRMVDPKFPMANHPDEVFAKGRHLEQVKSKDQVKPGTFYVDYAASKLYVGDQPTDIAATTLAEALYLHGADGSVVRGIGFRRYATPIKRLGAVKGYANNLTFENNVFADTALAGLSLRGSNITVRHNAFLRNGQLGLHANQTDHAKISGNLLEGNNAAHFKIIPVAGGMKVTKSRNTRIVDNLVRGNAGAGIWCDVACVNIVIARDVVTGNTGHGIQFEISDRALIVGNVVANNDRYGIRVLESSHARLWNNTVAGNALRQIDVLDGTRKEVGPITGTEIRDNLLEPKGGGSDQLLGVADSNARNPAKKMATTDANAYYRPSGKPNSVIHWADGPHSFADFGDLAKFRSDTGQEKNGIAVNEAAPFADRESYRLKPDSDPLRAGLPVPADVAALLGVKAGARAGIGAPGMP